MSNPPPPRQRVQSKAEARSPSLFDIASWSSFIERVCLLYRLDSPQIVVDRLSSQKEAELDRYLDAGIDINGVCVEGVMGKTAPLFFAIYKCCPPLVNALLERGARISMETLSADANSNPSIRESALGWSVFSYNPRDPQATAILNAVLAVPETLSPEEINLPLHVWQKPPLATCVQNRNALVRDILVANGADTGCLDKDGQTLLHLLATTEARSDEAVKEDEGWIRWILDHGVPIDATDVNGYTAQDLARWNRPDDGFVELLDRFMAAHHSCQLDRETLPVPGSTPARLRRM